MLKLFGNGYVLLATLCLTPSWETQIAAMKIGVS